MRAASAVALAATLIAFLCAGLWLGGHPNDLSEPLRDIFVSSGPTLPGEAAKTIEDNYYRQVRGAALDDASIRGMVTALRRRHREDRYTQYYDPAQAQALDDEISGQFTGVGLTVDQIKPGLKVVGVFKRSPAAEAGIKPDDVIVSVNGRSIAGQSSNLSTAEIKGPAGTEVALGVRRPSTGRTRQVRLKRAQITEPVVERRLRSFDGQRLGYVRLTGFSDGAHGPLRDAVQHLEQRGAKGIVLDLRDNPGGLLTEAVLTASIFLPKGEKVVTTDSRTEGREVHRAFGNPLRRLPMVVLINRETASAAEILASALADHGFAEVVGTRSFGKGLFQDVLNLSNGGELDLSVGEFFTADGVSLAPNGIKPDVYAKDNPATKADEALQRALQVLDAEVVRKGKASKPGAKSSTG